jgi:copper chaperone NosL
MVCAAVGVADFWRWEYDYGHDLDFENAIITIPGMSYQPPLIGSKQIANFVATSLPGPGGWAAGVAFLLVAAAVVLTVRQARTAPVPAQTRVADLRPLEA